MKVECIDYRQLPNLNPLLPQYLYQYDQVDTLYDCPVHLSLEDLKRRADSVLRNPPTFPRDQLVELTGRRFLGNSFDISKHWRTAILAPPIIL